MLVLEGELTDDVLKKQLLPVITLSTWLISKLIQSNFGDNSETKSDW